MLKPGLATAIAIGAICTLSTSTSAQTFPTRPITLVVPFPAGGGNDALARLVAERMSKTIGQQVIVENRGGAGGTVATRAIAKAPPDGHTILLSYTGTFAINPTLYPNSGYDPRKDFVAIGSIGTLTSVMVTHPSLPARSTQELIAHAKANPGKVNFAFVPGTVGHISTEMFARGAGITLTKIPYKGNGDAYAHLLGGHVQMMFVSILPVIGQIKGGKLNALAVASPQRSPLVPDVPTIAESGLPGFSAVISYGLAAPAGTPRPIVDRLAQAAAEAVRSEDFIKALDANGMLPFAGTPEELGQFIRNEIEKWGKVVAAAGMKKQ